MARQAWELVHYFWRLTKGRIAVALSLNVISSLTEGVSLVLLIPLIGMIDSSRSGTFADLPLIGDTLSEFNPGLLPLLGIFVAIIVLQALLMRFKALYLAHLMHKAMDRMRLDFFSAIGMARWDVLQTMRISDLQHLLSGETGRVQLAVTSLFTTAQAAILFVTYFVLAALVSWQMALFATVVGGILFVLLYPVRRRASLFGSDLSTLFRDQQAVQMEFLTGIRVAKSFAAESGYSERYQTHLERVRETTLGFTSVSSMGTLVFRIASAIAAAAFVYTAIVYFELDLARLIILLLIFIRLAPRFGIIQDSWQQFAVNLPAFGKLRDSAEYFEQRAELLPEPGAKPPELADRIRLEGVSLQYAGSARQSVTSLDVSIPARRITALIGPSGSGKSTIADMVMGLLRPTDGQIFIDDVPLDDTNRRLWRANVAFVPQEPFLLHDTIAANLRIASPDANDEQLWAALETAKAASFVRGLPDGLQTMVGERGTRFSGGERQRIALARALLCKPQLLILDEATSALDWENQKAISADIAALRGKLTILTIAHRPSMISFADDVIAIEDGRVVESGPFAELAGAPDSRLARLLREEGASA